MKTSLRITAIALVLVMTCMLFAGCATLKIEAIKKACEKEGLTISGSAAEENDSGMVSTWSATGGALLNPKTVIIIEFEKAEQAEAANSDQDSFLPAITSLISLLIETKSFTEGKFLVIYTDGASELVK